MDQQTLKDLLALINVRNLTLAAEQRNVSQSAYSRRLQAIELRHGITLFDRSRRPARPSPMLDAMRGDIELALSTLQRMEKRLSDSHTIEEHLTIVGMHSLSAGVLPIAMKRLGTLLDNHPVRMRSANRDGCFQLLMTGEVALMISYETDARALRAPPHLVTTKRLCQDPFVPVCNPVIHGSLSKLVSKSSPIPLLAYPTEVFLGRILSDDILPRSALAFSARLTAGMTSVLLGAAINGLGVAWLPASTAGEAIRSGRLIRIHDPAFPTLQLTVSMLWLRTPEMHRYDELHEALGGEIARAVGELHEAGFDERVAGT
ncbi:LysR substrate-binding domain-containing protein [Granulosicoccus sp. 3-233]|uniref:LysR substrate-binding domain-containing protein n=1 Tax=Granulosicoccus sp. 3-233 TaxID=3417969 RepID=UPI003D3421A5